SQVLSSQHHRARAPSKPSRAATAAQPRSGRRVLEGSAQPYARTGEAFHSTLGRSSAGVVAARGPSPLGCLRGRQHLRSGAAPEDRIMGEPRNHQPALGFRRAQRACVVALALTALACGNDEALTDEARVGFDEDAMAELRAVGLDRYAGKFEPSQTKDYGDGLFGYEFAADEHGPICLYGTPFSFGLRDQASKDLLIYLQGGGACWSELCAANEKATDR